MSYTVLARRYRSESFDAVVGQEAVARTLKNAIAGDRVAHAYLFTGTRGVGKTTMARILAKALNCLATDKPTTTPCCKCESCVAINEGNDIDVLEIDGASNTGVEHIRELRQNAIYRPARARFKIYIIDEVHMLSVSAFNALLKTLEEPPEHVKFILATTEANKVLPTILSRCQRFDFRNIQVEDIAGQLQKVLAGEGVEAEEVVVRRVARLARGSMRDALSLLDQLLSMGNGKLSVEVLGDLLGTPRSERIIDLVEAMGRGEAGEALRQVDGAVNDGLALEQLVEALQEHFRDLLMLRTCGADTELVELEPGPVRDKVAGQAQAFDEAALVYNITVMEELRRSLRGSGSGRALLEAAVVRLTESERFSDTKVLLEQLQQLQCGAPAAASAGRNAVSPATGSRPAAAAARAEEKPAATGWAGKREASAAPAPSSRAEKSESLSVPARMSGFAGTLAGDPARTAAQGTREAEVYLKYSEPTAWEDGRITAGFRQEQDGMRTFLEEQRGKREEIAKALSAVLAQPVTLEVDSIGGGSEVGKSRMKASPGAKPSQKEINEALSDRQVRQVQEILGGKVRQVDRQSEKE